MDVAASIISYKTLYNLHCPIVPKPDEEKLYPHGVVAKALQNVAFQDDGLIQYKAEVMLRIFEKDVKPLIGGRAKAMIVATSRVAGLRYFNIIKEKLKERGADYKVLYAFSDFVHPETNEAINEHAVNELKDGELTRTAPRKVSVQDMIDEIRAKFAISDEEALYIKQVTEAKAADPVIRGTVHAHRDDRIYLEGAYRGQVNGEIQDTYNDLVRYEELADPKYTDTGGIFDIMAITVIQSHLTAAA